MKTAVPAPAFLVQVTAHAWTPKQAERIKKQVEQMFAGADVAIVDNVPEVKAAPVERVSESFARVETPVFPVGASIALPGGLDTLPEALTKTPAAPVAPVKLDQKLRDLHTGAIVQVTEVNETNFQWHNIDPDCPENARTGFCPFASFADCYEIIPEGAQAPASDAVETGAASSPAAPVAATEETPAAAAPKKKRAHKPAAAAHSHTAHKPAAHARKAKHS